MVQRPGNRGNGMAAIKAWFRARFMYAVIFPEYGGLHWGWNWLEVEEWVAQYPVDTPRWYYCPRFGWMDV